jgi:2-oxo-4-hydroxy-4-carboxy-5-ureidoimidazoline decarboxylase
MEPWRRLDLATPGDAHELLRTCCGSAHWIRRMVARRPFHNRQGLLKAAREEWFALTPSDWQEAFAHHPKIGDRDALRHRFAGTRHLSEKEQAGVTMASDEVLDALADGNEMYETKFGYIFIVCATGRRADEMLAILQERLKNDSSAEIRIAAEEQAKITELRLLQLS